MAVMATSSGRLRKDLLVIPDSVYLHSTSVKTTIGTLIFPSPFTVEANTVML